MDLDGNNNKKKLLNMWRLALFPELCESLLFNSSGKIHCYDDVMMWWLSWDVLQQFTTLRRVAQTTKTLLYCKFWPSLTPSVLNGSITNVVKKKGHCASKERPIAHTVLLFFYANTTWHTVTWDLNSPHLHMTGLIWSLESPPRLIKLKKKKKKLKTFQGWWSHSSTSIYGYILSHGWNWRPM